MKINESYPLVHSLKRKGDHLQMCWGLSTQCQAPSQQEHQDLQYYGPFNLSGLYTLLSIDFCIFQLAVHTIDEIGSPKLLERMAWYKGFYPSNVILRKEIISGNNIFKKCFWCNFSRSLHCAFDRLDASAESIPVDFLRFSGVSLT